MSTKLITTLSLAAVLCLSPIDAIRYNPQQQLINNLLDQSASIKSLQFTPISNTPLESTTKSINNAYYNEVNGVATAGTVDQNGQYNNPTSTPKLTPYESKWEWWSSQDHMVALQVEYSNYHPSDQVWTCATLASKLSPQHHKPYPTIPPPSNLSTSQLLTIPSTTLPFFLSCCPTVYTPTTDSAYLATVDLELEYPFNGHNTNLNKVGCGHSQTTLPLSDSIFSTTGGQGDEYPRAVDKFGYRNTPNQWYYSKGDPKFPQSNPTTNPNPNVITYTEFKLPRNVKPAAVNYNRIRDGIESDENGQKDQHSSSPDDGNNPQDITIDLKPIQCQHRIMEQSGEGYHRVFSYTFDPTTCYVDHHGDDVGVDQITSPLPTTANCSYLALTHLPNSVFVDPYQISYTALALYHQRERQRAGDDQSIQSLDDDNYNPSITTTTTTTTLTKSSDIDWFLYDFVDVEAQMNNAVGNNLLIKFSAMNLVHDDQNVGHQNDHPNGHQNGQNNNNNGQHQAQSTHPLYKIEIPVHLRYAPSRFNVRKDIGDDNNNQSSTSSSTTTKQPQPQYQHTHQPTQSQSPNTDDLFSKLQYEFEQFLSTEQSGEFRYTTFMMEPQLFLFCTPTTPPTTSYDSDHGSGHGGSLKDSSSPNIVLPSIKQLFELRRDHLIGKMRLKDGHEQQHMNQQGRTQQKPTKTATTFSHRQNKSLPPVSMTVPVGSLGLYPITMMATFVVLILSAVLFHILIIGEWFEMNNDNDDHFSKKSSQKQPEKSKTD
jgi:hypothetical protein